MKNTLLALLGTILLTTPLAATAQQFGDFTYTSDGSAITITGYTGPGGAVTIPGTISGLPVTRIGDSAFESRANLTSVTIGNNVTNIGTRAFLGCSSLASVTIPNGLISIGAAAFFNCFNLTNVSIPNTVTSIGNSAFAGCNGLTSVSIPSSVTNIGDSAFGGCASLAAITVDSLNSSYGSVDGVLFNQSQTELIQYPGGKGSSYTIPASVTSIGDYAFNRSSLTNITIPSSVTNIGVAAFAYCTSLTKVTIPNSITSIRGATFAGCYILTSVTIGNNVTNIGDRAFAECFSLTSATVPASVTSIEDFAFADSGLTGLYFQGNAPSVGFLGADYTTVYYLAGTTGWAATLGGRPTVLWDPLMQASGPSFGVGPAGFGFNITGTADIPIVVEACTSLTDATWVALQSLNLTNGTVYFSDPNWVNFPARHYRIRSR